MLLIKLLAFANLITNGLATHRARKFRAVKYSEPLRTRTEKEFATGYYTNFRATVITDQSSCGVYIVLNHLVLTACR